ncbi:Rcbtb2 [Symbiodinium natans]|uniref:Rcbtb2 protein n=1 Tax=Symbiodinium natans TaxID=878477 RepID=A0A812SD07_9DINO|nr:Rcbtb2 [Symbiodinium natans]
MPITAAELTSKAMVNCPEDLPAQTGALQVQSVFAKNACRGLLYPKSTSNVLRLEKSTYTWSTWNVTTPVFQVCKLPSMSCLELISLEAAMLNSVEPLGLSTTGPQVYSRQMSEDLDLIFLCCRLFGYEAIGHLCLHLECDAAKVAGALGLSLQRLNAAPPRDLEDLCATLLTSRIRLETFGFFFGFWAFPRDSQDFAHKAAKESSDQLLSDAKIKYVHESR